MDTLYEGLYVFKYQSVAHYVDIYYIIYFFDLKKIYVYIYFFNLKNILN